jgi:hypothetical protein
VIVLTEAASKTEGRRGSQRRLDEGGRYLGIPRKGDFTVVRGKRDDVTPHNCGVLSVQETGCDTASLSAPSESKSTASSPDGSKRTATFACGNFFPQRMTSAVGGGASINDVHLTSGAFPIS